MFDFPLMPEDATKASWVFCAFLYFSFMFFYRKQFTSAVNLGGSHYEFKNKRLFYILSFIFVICPFYAGDFAHYQTLVWEYDGQEIYHLEKIYRYLIPYINNNYLLFRLIVWGGGYWVMFKAFKMYDVKQDFTFYFLFCIFISSFSYARAGVAFSVYCLAVSILFADEKMKSAYRYLLGFSLLFLAYSLHKSMIVLILIVPISYLKIQRKTIPLILIGILGIYFFSSGLLALAETQLMDSEDLSTSAELYMQNAGSASASGGLQLLFFLWGKLIVHLPFLTMVYYVFSNNNEKMLPTNIKHIFRICFSVYVFSIFMFISFGSASALYYRYEGLLYIPMTVVLCYLRQIGKIPSKVFLTVFWISSSYMMQLFLYRLIFR